MAAIRLWTLLQLGLALAINVPWYRLHSIHRSIAAKELGRRASTSDQESAGSPTVRHRRPDAGYAGYAARADSCPRLDAIIANAVRYGASPEADLILLHAFTVACLADNSQLVALLMSQYNLGPLIALEFGVHLPPSGTDHSGLMQAIATQVRLHGFTGANKDSLHARLAETE